MIADLESRDILAAHGERMAREQPAAALLYRQISQLTPARFQGGGARAHHAACATRPPALLAELPMPVLFLTGEEDCRVSRRPAGPGLRRARAARAARVCVPKAGHSVYFERAAEFNRIVEEFLHMRRPS